MSKTKKIIFAIVAILMTIFIGAYASGIRITTPKQWEQKVAEADMTFYDEDNNLIIVNSR